MSFGSLSLGLSLSAQRVAAGGGGGGTFPFAVGTIGVESDWTLTGSFSWDAGTSSIRVNGSSGSATLTGAALTAFNTAIANNTGYNADVTLADVSDFGQALVSVKGGTDAALEGEADGVSQAAATSSTGSGFVFTANASFPPNWRMTTLVLTPN